MAKAKKIKVTLVRSVAGTLPAQRRTVKALGLGRISSSVVHEATDPILGMVRTVSHLVKVEEL
ncbi:MAG TPA: 50S ribosomal protein L30 [Sphaerochaeta sp.]|nr:50S ribosomal protein L30 [Sphaerochaeta sp.]